MHTFTKLKYHYNVEVPYNIAFMHQGRIPTFYLANLESRSLSQINTVNQHNICLKKFFSSIGFELGHREAICVLT